MTELQKKAGERDSYELFKLQGGEFASRLKSDFSGTAAYGSAAVPPHYICQPRLDVCGQKVVLQERAFSYNCNECKTAMSNDQSAMFIG